MQTMLAILTAMALSLGVALLMERALFRLMLKAMVVAPRRAQYSLAEAKTHLRQIRNAGL